MDSRSAAWGLLAHHVETARLLSSNGGARQESASPCIRVDREFARGLGLDSYPAGMRLWVSTRSGYAYVEVTDG